MNLNAQLVDTLEAVAAAMEPAQHDWWVIASAACALHEIDPGPVRDVDVLIDERDLGAVLGPLNLPITPGSGDGLFRSRYFVTWTAPPLSVEFFAGFDLCKAGRWEKVRLATREWRNAASALIAVPSRGELTDLLRRFGRPKDLVRAELLSPSGPFPSRSESA
jgi:hypothetical protein